MAVSTLVHGLGGPREVAARLQISNENAVAQWIWRDTVPYRWRTRLTELADARGYKLNDAERAALEFD